MGSKTVKTSRGKAGRADAMTRTGKVWEKNKKSTTDGCGSVSQAVADNREGMNGWRVPAAAAVKCSRRIGWTSKDLEEVAEWWRDELQRN